MPVIGKLLVIAVAIAQASGSSAAANDNLSLLDQVDIYGTKTLSELRQDLVEAEDRFYERYNELNTNDAFDVNCRREARTGTRLERRICRVVYQEEAIREGAKDGIETQQRAQDELRGVMPRSPPVPAAVQILARQPEFQSNMRSVVSRSRVLTRLLKERAEAEAKLEAAYLDVYGPENTENPPPDSPAAEDGQGVTPPPGNAP